MARMDFYDGDKLIVAVDAEIIPPVGARMSIRKQTYEVRRVTYAIDYSDNEVLKNLRANIDLVVV